MFKLKIQLEDFWRERKGRTSMAKRPGDSRNTKGKKQKKLTSDDLVKELKERHGNVHKIVIEELRTRQK